MRMAPNPSNLRNTRGFLSVLCGVKEAKKKKGGGGSEEEYLVLLACMVLLGDAGAERCLYR